jgi:hypothetical protein
MNGDKYCLAAASKEMEPEILELYQKSASDSNTKLQAEMIISLYQMFNCRPGTQKTRWEYRILSLYRNYVISQKYRNYVIITKP